VFLSGEHLRYWKSCGISVILVLFWYVFAASPDAGLERWCVWFNYVPVFLSVLAVAYLLVACVFFFFLNDARSKPAIPKVHRMSQHTWAQSTLQLIPLLRAGHGKVLATECVRRW